MIEIMSAPYIRPFENAPVQLLNEGATLFRRDDTVKKAFLVREGHVFLRRALSDGGLLTLHVATEGALVAEASLFADRYHCDAVTDVRTTVAVLPREKLLAQLANTTSSALSAFERTAKELQTTRMRIEIMRLKKVTDRLDAYLDVFGPPAVGAWVRVADWIGVSPPALYRELARRRLD